MNLQLNKTTRKGDSIFESIDVGTFDFASLEINPEAGEIETSEPPEFLQPTSEKLRLFATGSRSRLLIIQNRSEYLVVDVSGEVVGRSFDYDKSVEFGKSLLRRSFGMGDKSCLVVRTID